MKRLKTVIKEVSKIMGSHKPHIGENSFFSIYESHSGFREGKYFHLIFTQQRGEATYEVEICSTTDEPFFWSGVMSAIEPNAIIKMKDSNLNPIFENILSSQLSKIQKL